MLHVLGEQGLIDSEPVKPGNPKYPAEQLKYLGVNLDVVVYPVKQTTITKRHSDSFYDLLKEEKKLYLAHGQDGKPPKLKHFAWHGAPVRNIIGILQTGFLITPGLGLNGKVYGHGIYLATEPYGRGCLSPKYSAPDSNGWQYMLLCEILPGTVEPSKRGQVRPTNLHTVHSGVDSLPNPYLHVIWSYDMNSRIRPMYLVVCRKKN